MALWKRDNYFQQSKPPPTFAKSNLPVSYITSGYEIDPTESVKLQIFVDGNPDSYVTGKFSCNFGIISWPVKGKTTVGRMNKALKVFALYTPTTYDARNDSNLLNIAVFNSLLKSRKKTRRHRHFYRNRRARVHNSVSSNNSLEQIASFDASNF
jgi:hypothetical protein